MALGSWRLGDVLFRKYRCHSRENGNPSCTQVGCQGFSFLEIALDPGFRMHHDG